MAALCEAVEYLVTHRIPGGILECGVWRGGSMMAVAETLLRLGVRDRDLFLCDTFAGMTPPTVVDVAFDGSPAEALLAAQSPADPVSVWCVAGLDEVRANLAATGYPSERLHFVRGRVEETLPAAAPKQIALLRLDTDWYESTRHELEHLFPRIPAGGVLIVDDYGHWQGSQRAVDEYFARYRTPILLQRIDYTGRLGVVVGASRQAA